MLKLKTFLKIFILLLLTVSAGFIYASSRRFTEHLKTYLQNRLTRETALPVEIDRVTTDIFNNIVVHGIYINDPGTEEALLEIGRVRVRYSLMRFLREKPALRELIREVFVYGPVLTARHGSEGFSIDGLDALAAAQGGEAGRVPPWRVNLFNGKVRYIHNDSEYEFEGIDGRILPGGYPEIAASASFTVKDFIQDLRINGSLHLISGEIEGVLRARGAELEPVSRLFETGDIPGFDSGSASVNLKVRSNINNITEGLGVLKMNGEVIVESARMGEILVRRAVLNISPERILVTESLMDWDGNTFTVSGALRDYLDRPRLDLRAKGEADARKALKRAGIKNVSGKIEFDGALEGEVSELRASGDIFMETGKVAGIDVERLETYAEFRLGRIEIGSGSAFIGGGSLMWEGTWDPGGEVDMQLKGTGIKIDDLDFPGGVSGEISSSIGVSGDASSPEVRSALTLDGFRLPGREFGHISARAFFTGSTLKAEAFTLDGLYSAELEAHYDSVVWNIRSAGINARGGRVEIGGRLSPGKSFELSAEARDIDLLDIPEVFALYPDASGRVDFSFEAVSAEEKVETALAVNGEEVYIGGEKFGFSASAGADFYGGDIIGKVRDLKVGSYLDISAGFAVFPQGFTVTDSTVAVSAAPVKKLMALTGRDSEGYSGDVWGFFSHNSGEGKGSFECIGLAAAEINLGDFSAEISGDNGKWTIENFELTSDGGALTATGELYPSQKITGGFDSYPLKGRRIDLQGSFTSRDTGEGYGFLAKAEGVSINGRKWSSFRAEGNFTSSERRIKVEAPGSFSGEIAAERSEGGRVEGEISFNDFEAGGLLELVGPGADAGGRLSGQLKIMGVRENPLLYFRGGLEEGNLYGVDTNADFGVEVQGRSLRVLEFEGKSGGGTVTASGSITPDDISMTVSVSGFGLTSLGYLNHPFKDGSLNADITASGSPENPVLEADVKGENLELEGLKLREVSGSFTHKDEMTSIRDLLVKTEAGSLAVNSGRVAGIPGGGVSFEGEVFMNNLRVGPSALLGRGKVSGEYNPEPGNITAEFTPSGMLFNRLSISRPFKIGYSGTTLTLDFERGPLLSASFTEDGVRVEELKLDLPGKTLSGRGFISEEDIRVDIRSEGVDIGKVLSAADIDFDYSGESDFDVRVRGSFKDPRGSASVRVRNGFLGGAGTGSAKADLTYRDGKISVDRLSLYRENLIDLEVSGDIGRKLDLDVDVRRLSLGLLKELGEEFEDAGGYFTGSFRAEGSLESPDISGRAALEEGYLSGKTLFDRISSINCVIEAEGSIVKVSELEALWLPGRVTGSGYADFSRRPVDINIELKTPEKGVLVKVPYLDIPQSTLFGRLLTLPSSGEPRFDVSITNDESGAVTVKGDVTLYDTHFTYPPAMGPRSAPPPSLPFDLLMDLNLIAGESVWYENTFARIRLDGALNFRVDRAGSLLVNGEISSSQGNVTYLNRDFSIEQAVLVFDDSVEHITASASAEMERTIDGDRVEDLIELSIPRSRVADIRPVFSSGRFADRTDSREAMEAVISGTGLRELTQEERVHVMRRELLRAIDANLTSPLVKSLLGRMDLVDVARVDVRVSEDAESDMYLLEGAGVQLGRHFTDRFYMGYYMEFDRGLRLHNELDMLYRLQGSQFLKGSVDEERRFYLGLEQRIRF